MSDGAELHLPALGPVGPRMDRMILVPLHHACRRRALPAIPVPAEAPLDWQAWFQAVLVNHNEFGPVVSVVMEAAVVSR